ncbi:hypothetical protein [Acidovorax sp. M2(2025)]|uniref:hypothetical protein n=1 Tax=Acidovorax sp. M2(2025) TaxID=3411355 RepID=UPI003BF59ABD
MSDPDKLAIAAHLHVLLRRKTGRVTDTEWMAANAEYAQEVVRFARQRAREDNAPELAEWADRLEHALLATPAAAPRRPLLDAAAQAVRQRAAPAAPAATPAPEAPRYVGGIR